MLEKMGKFFDNRIDGYEEHQLTCIEGAKEFYPLTASLLPNGNLLDLGCGTGLELEYYFINNPNSKVTCIDLAPKMLSKLKEKFSNYDVICILDDYFKYNFEESYDAIVSVESLHHFEKDKKVSLYKKLYQCLKKDGVFILTDYFSKDDDEENYFQNELKRLKKEQKLQDNEFYHYDTPLTLNHEIEALKEAGFIVEIIQSWTSTSILKATKPKKILVIGCPGSGKSTLARQLKEYTNLPLYYLDMMYWNEDKTTVSKDVFNERLNNVLNQDEWIIDGNYQSSMELRMKYCDTIIFLDYEVETCLSGIKQRQGKKREDMPWIEESDDLEFIEFIRKFNEHNRPIILELLEKYKDKKVLVFKNREEVNEYLDKATNS